MKKPIEIPEGYKMDGQGRLIPITLMKPIAKKRDKLVSQMIKDAYRMQTIVGKFKIKQFAKIESWIDYSKSQYGSNEGGLKGNITLKTFDDKQKVTHQVSVTQKFDERLQIAKDLLDEFIIEKADKTDDAEIKALLQQAFDTDSKGAVSTAKIFSLLSWNIKSPKWEQAMEAIKDSVYSSGSKLYIRFHERDENGKWQPISIDMKGA